MKFPLVLCLLLAASIDATANRATRRSAKTAAIQPVTDRYLSVAEAAEYLGVNAMTVRNMLKDGRLTGVTLGHRVLRIRLSDIEKSLQPWGGGA